MQEVLITFLSQFKELTKAQIHELAQLMRVETFSKNSIVVKAGEACGKCYFVLQGCLRQYLFQDGNEKTIALYTEYQAVNYFTNQSEQTKTDTYLTCVEDSILLIGNPVEDIVLYERFPELATITRTMLEAELGKTQVALAKMITSTPEERYTQLMMERPDLLNRVPQHMIASYLGITPESLSRIRKRLWQKTN